MITKEQAEEMLPEEAVQVNVKEVKDLETIQILISKALFYLAVRDEIKMYIDDNNKIFYSEE